MCIEYTVSYGLITLNKFNPNLDRIECHIMKYLDNVP